jgi:hypothetical protein
MRRLLTLAMHAALLEAASRDFAALGPSVISRRTADQLARRGLMRVEWCAVLTADGARLAQSLSRLSDQARRPPTQLTPATDEVTAQ